MRKWFVREGRLRSGWRLVSYIVTAQASMLVLSVLIGLGIGVYLASTGLPLQEIPAGIGRLVSSPANAWPIFILIEFGQFLLIAAIVYLWRHALDKRDFRSLGFQLTPGWWQEFLLGVGLIALTWAIIFAASLVTSVVQIESPAAEPAAFVSLAAGIVFNLLVGLYEETDGRGYVMQTLADGIGLFPAILLSSLYFGALHLLNPGAGPASTLGTGLFGVLAGLSFWATRRLWIAIGMHAAWNLFEGPVFGFPVSGLSMGGLFKLAINGPSWLTGSRFGPEAGALTYIPLVILCIVIYAWGRGRRPTTGLLTERLK